MAASLLKRLARNADPTSSGRSVYRGDDLEASVLAHLEQMLNTRAGSAPAAPEYGIVELSELLHDFPDADGIMQRSIKATIVKHEPRLKNVQVKVVNHEDSRDSLFVYYEVNAQLVHPDGGRQQIRFSTSIDESSNVQVA